ncbi:MAG: cell division protein FtsL [Clostridia bacterium]|nr:cell division protein FtsL [Clostridia bacterium]
MKRKLLSFLLFAAVAIYAIVTLINQQITLNRYKDEQAKLTQQIKEEEDYKKNLVATKDNVNSEQFIEEMAREKLDMYLPTEKVYIDTGM